MEEHISKLWTAWAKANGQGAAIGDVKFHMIVLRLLPPAWLAFVGTLFNEPTSDSVIAHLTSNARLIATQ